MSTVFVSDDMLAKTLVDRLNIMNHATTVHVPICAVGEEDKSWVTKVPVRKSSGQDVWFSLPTDYRLSVPNGQVRDPHLSSRCGFLSFPRPYVKGFIILK